MAVDEIPVARASVPTALELAWAAYENVPSAVELNASAVAAAPSAAPY